MSKQGTKLRSLRTKNRKYTSPLYTRLVILDIHNARDVISHKLLQLIREHCFCYVDNGNDRYNIYHVETLDKDLNLVIDKEDELFEELVKLQRVINAQGATYARFG